MATEDLSMQPQHVTDRIWYYEEKEGICVVHEVSHGDVKQFYIPWRLIRASVRRKDDRDGRTRPYKAVARVSSLLAERDD